MPEPVSSSDQLFGLNPRRDPAWEEAKRQLWAMTANERRAAMYAGRLTLRLCLHWASRTPREVPLLDGEWAFIANATPEVAERRELTAAPRDARSARR